MVEGNLISRFLIRYNDTEIYLKAKILLFISLLLLTISLVYALLAFTIMNAPLNATISFISSIICLINIYFLYKGNYGVSSTIIVYLVWAAFSFLGALPIVFLGRPPSVFTRNVLISYFFIVLFTEKQSQLAIIYFVSTAFLISVHFPNPVSSRLNLTGFDPNLINELIVLTVAYFMSILKISINLKIIKRTEKKATENKERFNQLEILLNSTKETMNIGKDVITISEKMNKFDTEMKDNLNFIANDIHNLNSEIMDSTSNNTDLIDYSKKLKTTILNQNTAINQQSASVEEMSRSVQNISELSLSKIKSIDELKKITGISEEKMAESLQFIEEINNSAENMLSIIDVIVNVAEQTDMLAMNAAIEAAHAGDSGKGFAVIAEEIRRLAEQTSDNTGIITQSLKKNIDDISKAVTSTKETDNFFQQMNNEIKYITEAFSDIVNTVNEVSQGTSELLKTVEHLTELSNEVETSINSMDQLANKNKESNDKTIELSLDIKRNIDDNISKLLQEFSEIIDKSNNLQVLGKENEQNINHLFEEIVRIKSNNSSSVISL